MSFSKVVLAGLAASLLAAGPGLAQQAKPKAPTNKKPVAPAKKPVAAAKTAAAPATDDTKKFFRLSAEHPVAGQPLTLSYSPAGGPLAGKEGIRGVVYYFNINNLRWEASDLPLQAGATAGELTTTFTPPATTGFAAFKFVAADGTTDNHHDEGYYQLLNDPAKPDQPASGGYLAYGLLRKPDFGLSVPGYFEKYTISDVALYLWLKQEMRFHPENAPALMPQLLQVTQKTPTYLPKPFATYAPMVLRLASRQVGQQPSPREIDLLGIEQGYRQLENHPAQADSVARVLAQRFPQGYLARQAQYLAANKEPDLAKKQALLEAFLQAYPPTPAYLAPARYSIDYNRVYESIILLNMSHKNYPALYTYVPKLSYVGLLNMYYKAVQNSIRPGILTPAEGLPYATLIMQRLDEVAAQRPAEYAYLSPQEWTQYHAEKTNAFRIHYATLLAEQGQGAKAEPYAAAAQRVAKFEDATLNDTQAGLLHAGGSAQQAPLRQLLETSVNHNQATPRMLEWLRESYTATHPGGAGYDQYLASLQNVAAKRAARAELAKEMFKKPIIDFALRDLDGKLVRLSEQKGKTVVLDFWATWCVPCKASFPGMKLAQERFKDNPNVVFYFIDTEEYEPTYKEDVRDYIKAKNLPFQVLFDEKGPSGKSTDALYTKYTNAYQLSGIPQKLVIDPQGNLRFIVVGYKGSPTALADEIQNMVELVSTEK